MSRIGVVCAILSCDATITSDHDAIMSVCGEENGKEVNSKCGKIASALIVRITILGGIGVIQHRVTGVLLLFALLRMPPSCLSAAFCCTSHREQAKAHGDCGGGSKKGTLAVPKFQRP